MEPSTTFGEQFRAWRKAANLTQRELADRLGVDFTYLSKIENNRNPVPPSVRLLTMAAAILKVDEREMVALSGRTTQISILDWERFKRIEKAALRIEAAGILTRDGATVTVDRAYLTMLMVALGR